jgi:hypothetical protein
MLKRDFYVKRFQVGQTPGFRDLRPSVEPVTDREKHILNPFFYGTILPVPPWTMVPLVLIILTIAIL